MREPFLHRVQCLPLAIALLLTACSDSGTDVTPVATVELEAPAEYMEEGSTMQVTATAKDIEGNVLAGREITFTTSDESVATVSESGLVTGVAPGSVQIRATSGEKSASAEVAVREAGPLPNELSGTIRRVRFEIEEGATHTVTSDLVVFADEAIEVRGELVPAEPGVAISLISKEELRIAGVVGDTSGLGEMVEEEAVPRRAASPAQSSPPPGVMFMSGNQIFITGWVTTLTDDIAIAGLAPEARVFISGSVGVGRQFRKTQPGGSVHIGTAHANGIAREMAEEPAIPVLVEINKGWLWAGQGGPGVRLMDFDRRVGDLAIVHNNSPGGRGGDLSLEADLIRMIGSPRLRGGRGGPGGAVGSGAGLLEAENGAAPQEKGESIDVMTGPGGDGGDLIISGTVEGDFDGRPGPAGRPGDAYVVPGDGSPAGGGDGGDATILVGPSGKPGQGPGEARPPQATDILLEGGNGGDSSDPDMRGGAGGTFVIDQVEPDPQARPRAYFRSPVAGRRVAAGGAGADACAPVGRGSRGGLGGMISVPQDEFYSLTITPEHLLAGGPGGNGIPPGVGGIGGIAELPNGTWEGSPGPDGIQCPLAAVVDPPQVFFSHMPRDPCPADIGSVTLTNAGTKPFDFTVEPGEEAGAIEFGIQAGRLQPGESLDISIKLECATSGDFVGSFDFVLEAEDESPQTHTVTVEGTIELPPNEPPVFNNGEGGISTQTGLNEAVDVTVPFSDPDGDQLAFSIATQPAHGTASDPDPVTGDGSGATTVVTYTPGEGFVGSDSFTVLADDGRGGVAEGKITVTVDEVSGTTKTFRLDFGNVPSAPAANSQHALGVIRQTTGDEEGSIPMRIMENPSVEREGAYMKVLSAARNQGLAFELLNLQLNDIGTGALSLMELCFRSLGGGTAVDVRRIDDQGEHVFPEVQVTEPGCGDYDTTGVAYLFVQSDAGGFFELREPGAEM